MKKNKKGIVYVALCIDNNLMKGDVEAIDDAITALKENRLVLKIVERLQDYLSCKDVFSTGKKRTASSPGKPYRISL